jgi:hypothetical protein
MSQFVTSWLHVLQGIPEAAEVAVPVARNPATVPGAPATTAPAPAVPAVPAPAAPGGPNAAPLDLFPQVWFEIAVRIRIEIWDVHQRDTYTSQPFLPKIVHVCGLKISMFYLCL